MKYVIIDTDKHNGTQIGPSYFYARAILSGDYAKKFATSENALTEFAEIFKTQKYTIADLPDSIFEIDYTKSKLVQSGYFIISKSDDYMDETCTIVYLKNGTPEKIVLDMKTTAAGKTGYAVDLTKTQF